MNECSEGQLVGSYLTTPGAGGYPSIGHTEFRYYDNEHWARLGREATACGPAAACTAARFQRQDDLCASELKGAVNDLGPFGTSYAGILRMLCMLSVRHTTEWVWGDTSKYIKSIRGKLREKIPVIVLVDWGTEYPFWKVTEWGGHYMVAFGASDDLVYFTNIGNVSGKTSTNTGFTDERLQVLLSGWLLQAAGFRLGNLGYRLVCIEPKRWLIA